MIFEIFNGFLSGIADFFRNGGIITYIITFIGIYGFILSIQKIRYLPDISYKQILLTAA